MLQFHSNEVTSHSPLWPVQSPCARVQIIAWIRVRRPIVSDQCTCPVVSGPTCRYRCCGAMVSTSDFDSDYLGSSPSNAFAKTFIDNQMAMMLLVSIDFGVGSTTSECMSLIELQVEKNPLHFYLTVDLYHCNGAVTRSAITLSRPLIGPRLDRYQEAMHICTCFDQGL